MEGFQRKNIFLGKTTYENSGIASRIETLQGCIDKMIRAVSQEKSVAVNNVLYMPAGLTPKEKKNTIGVLESHRESIASSVRECFDVADALTDVGFRASEIMRSIDSGMMNAEEAVGELGVLIKEKERIAARAGAALRDINRRSQEVCSSLGIRPIVIDTKDPLASVVQIASDYQHIGLNLEKSLEQMLKFGGKKRDTNAILKKGHAELSRALGEEAKSVTDSYSGIPENTRKFMGIPDVSIPGDADLVICSELPEYILETGPSARTMQIDMVDNKTASMFRKTAAVHDGGKMNGREQMYIYKSDWDELVSDAFPIIGGRITDLTGKAAGFTSVKTSSVIAQALDAHGYSEKNTLGLTASQVERAVIGAVTDINFPEVTIGKVCRYINFRSNANRRLSVEVSTKMRADLEICEKLRSRFEEKSAGENNPGGNGTPGENSAPGGR